LGVVHAGDIEAEEIAEFAFVASEVGQRGEIFGANLGRDFDYGLREILLECGLHFEVVQADAGGIVEAGRAGECLLQDFRARRAYLRLRRQPLSGQRASNGAAVSGTVESEKGAVVDQAETNLCCFEQQSYLVPA
jgi:hypothetical protein